MRYFLKELVSTPLYLPTGGKIGWEELQGDQGALATEDGALLHQLDMAIRRKVGGVREITAEQYEEVKKNSQSIPTSSLNSLNVRDAKRMIEQLQAQIARLEGRPVVEAGKDTAMRQPPLSPVHESEPLVVPDLEPVVMRPAARGRKRQGVVPEAVGVEPSPVTDQGQGVVEPIQ